MKKIILILLIPLFLGGCYDYNQLDDLAIISGIAIDYKDDKFEVTFEIISTKKEGETSASSNTYYVTSKGESLVYAFTESANKIDKVPYFEHIEVVIFSKDVALYHLEDCVDYLIRSERLRNEFYAVIAEDSAKDLISASSSEHPIVSSFLVQLLEYNAETFNSAYYIQFTKTLNSILSEGQDAMMPIFQVDDDKNIDLKGLGVFKDYQLVQTFNNEEASIINMLDNFNVESIHFNMTCDQDKNIVIADYKSDFSIEPNQDYILVKGVINARISENNCDYDLKDAKTYQQLEKDFTKIIEKDIDQVLKKLQESQSNALNIGRSYYSKYRVKDFYLWTKQDIRYDIDLKINKKGLTFEVEQ